MFDIGECDGEDSFIDLELEGNCSSSVCLESSSRSYSFNLSYLLLVVNKNVFVPCNMSCCHRICKPV